MSTSENSVAKPLSEGARQLREVPLSYREIGRIVGRAGVTVRFWAIGLHVPHPDTRRALAAAFGIAPPSWLQPATEPAQGHRDSPARRACQRSASWSHRGSAKLIQRWALPGG